jgi:prolyl-tRNA synthetase
MKLNQWNNVVRWEFKHPTPFLRTGSSSGTRATASTPARRRRSTSEIRYLEYITKVLKDYLALPGIIGRKTEQEKFAGGVASYSIEHMMPDGWAIQGPAWHYDGQKFAKVFEHKLPQQERAEGVRMAEHLCDNHKGAGDRCSRFTGTTRVS